MFKYTICFIRQGQKILLLNREKSEWMGVWNGVGGKIDEGETPLQCILREVEEETGIKLNEKMVKYKGDVTWTDPANTYFGGMYVFVAELPTNYQYTTPVKSDEGILDWKEMSWILHPENYGIANLKYFLKEIFNEATNYEHQFTYEKTTVKHFARFPLKETKSNQTVKM